MNEPTSGSEEAAEAGGSSVPPGDGGRRRVTIIAVVSVLVAAVLGVGAYAAYRLAGGGPQPAEVLPASTIAYASVDLDPSASQKIQAIRTLRKIPDLRKSLDLDTTDDVRRFVFDKAIGADCPSVSFDRDVKPWLGDRGALGAVDLGSGSPIPVAALQVSDTDEVKTGVQKIIACAHPADFGYALTDDFLVISDSDAHARSIVAAGGRHALADDAGYRKWSGRVGDPGVVSFYVSPAAARFGLDQLHSEVGDTLGSLDSALRGFRGLAGTVRFSDGGAELAVAFGGVEGAAGSTPVGPEVGRLPADTAVAFALGVPDDYAQKLVDQLGSDGQGLVDEAETQTGLRLPGDLQTLLGNALVLTVGGTPPAGFTTIDDPRGVPAAVTVTGDTARISAVIDRMQEHVGTTLASLGIAEQKDDQRLALATSDTYAREVLRGGRLGDTDAFRGVVPDADRAAGVFFVQLSDAWRAKLVELTRHDSGPADATRVGQDLEPLEALGASSWTDHGVSHLLVRLTTR